MDTLYYLFVILGFLAVVLFIEGAYIAWDAYRGPEARRIAQRLRALSAGHDATPALLKQRLLSDIPAFQTLLLRLPRIHHLDRFLMQSGTRLNAGSFVGLTLILCFGGMVLLMLRGTGIWAALPVSLLPAALPFLFVQNQRRKRLIRVESQLPDALDLMARAMRAGHAFPSALQMVGSEGPEPIAAEFKTTADEINFGIAMHDALSGMATRIPSTDLRYFVIAVMIQRETGGNLAELLNNMSQLIRARLKLLGTIRVLTAEGRISAWILGLLPFAVAGVISLINPGFLKVLWTDPVGLKMVGGIAMAMVFGVLWMRHIIRIRV